MTMDELMEACEKYRETIGADPSYDGDDRHLAECDSCKAYQRELQAFDKDIARALALTVPNLAIPDLPDVDTSNVATLPKRRITVPAWIAMAATVAAVAVLGFRTLGTGIGDLSLADQIIAHLDHEPYALRVTDKRVSKERLARVVPANVATIDHSAGLITYAQSCIINGKSVPHLVIQGKRGPVTILLMENEKVSRSQSIAGESVNGVILPVGNGSIAIIGEDGEKLDQIEQKVKSSVAWET